jgi:nucleoside-diphosphate-sugar epimerase
MKFLVLGSAGQVGQPLCQYLRSINQEVTTFDIVDSLDQDLRIPNNQLLVDAVNNCDFVFFLAWDVGGSRYLMQYQKTFKFAQNNIAIMHNVFSVLAQANKPFIFLSSQMSDIRDSVYGLTKLLGEKVAKSLNSIVVKLWNVYGLEHDFEKSHVITDFIQQAMNNKHINMLTTGHEQRQFLYAVDCAKCLYTLSQQYVTLPKDQEYHITSFEWTPIRKVAELVSEQLPAEITAQDNTDQIQNGHLVEPNRDILKYWKPETDLATGIGYLIEQNKRD